MTDHEQADVVILGGGPAGCATALALRTHAPSLSVALVEANGYDRPRIGEVLPAAARAPLAQLGLWEAFQAEQYQPAHSTSAAWGQAWPQAEHSLTSARGAGWHLERTRFDAWLAAQATARGVRFYKSSARLVDAQRTETNWRLCWSNELTVPTRFVVDASGRCSTFARSQGARLTSYDQLVGYARSFTLAEAAASETLVEAFADGWWYTTLAGGARVVVCLTDRDLAGRLGLRAEPHCMARSTKASAMRLVVPTNRPPRLACTEAPLRMCRVGRLHRGCGIGLAVGRGRHAP